jgi:hypothetical protein
MRWLACRLMMSMSVYLDGQAQYDNAAHHDDIFDPFRGILVSQALSKPLRKMHDSTSSRMEAERQNRRGTAVSPWEEGLPPYIKRSSGF